MKSNFFLNRKVCVATMHGKESVIGPRLEKVFGLRIEIPGEFNTDLLGTFTGETPRILSPMDAAREKCRQAMVLTGCDLAVASEGSFGAHPNVFFASANEELLVLVDRKYDLEISVRYLTTETNLNGAWISDEDALEHFARAAKFPSHGLILSTAEKDAQDRTKGITDRVNLFATFNKYMREYSRVYVETDMRACFNPTRMHAIGHAADQLVERMQSLCPECNTPGFAVKDRKSGLPCRWCAHPTQSTLSFLHRCDACGYEKEEHFPHGKEYEEQMYCDVCNP